MSPSEPEQPPFMEQARIVDEVALLVLDELPQPWDRAVLEFRAVTGSAEDALHVFHDGRQREDFPPVTTSRLLFRLRRVMYVPGAGTWFTMELEITPDGRTATRFDYDTEPAWALPPDDATYVEDLEKFPRDEEHVPEWLRRKLPRGSALRRGELDDAAWAGLRFEASFTPTGSVSTALDFQPSPDASRWAEEIVAVLDGQGIPARVGEDIDEESGSTFPIVDVELGSGHCGLAFWAEQVFWTADVAASQADLPTAQRVATAVRRAVEDVTGWVFVHAKVTTAYERAVMGLPPA
jgi:hypothetical protein